MGDSPRADAAADRPAADATDDDSTDTRLPTLTRRRALVGGCTSILGVGALTVLTGRDPATAAEVEMGTLTVAGDSATLAEPPQEVMVQVTGEWSVSAPSTVPQTRLVLQLHANGKADDLDEQVNLDAPMGGAFTLQADLLDHRAVSGEWFVPDEAGATVEKTVNVRIILMVVEDNAVVTETFIEREATLTLTADGIELSVGGTGSIDVVTA